MQSGLDPSVPLQLMSNAVLVADTTMENAPIFPCSALTGDGIPALKAYLYDAADRCARHVATGQFRLAVDRTFILTGAGLIVTGTVFSGTTRVGDRLVLSPQGLPARIRSIHSQNQESQTGSAGQRCALNLTGAGVDRAAVSRDDWVLAGGAWVSVESLLASLLVVVSLCWLPLLVVVSLCWLWLLALNS